MSTREPERLSVPPDGRPDAQQPRWRQDFPIDWPQDTYVSRRDFVKFMLLTSLAFTAGQFWVLIQNYIRQRRGQPPIREVARLTDLPVGGALLFDYPEPRATRVLARLDERTLVAYAQQCTHLTCPVIARPEEGRLHCPCHEGVFDLATGRPLAGPPRRPLPRVTLEVRDGVIYATGIEERTV
jgi:nitrite reductase/ring-hydroxylating ferredoxin subunit